MKVLSGNPTGKACLRERLLLGKSEGDIHGELSARPHSPACSFSHSPSLQGSGNDSLAQH